MLTPTLLLAIVLGLDDPNSQSGNDKILTPAEFVAGAKADLWMDFRTVRFNVSDVTAERLTGLDGASCTEYRLHPDTFVGSVDLGGATGAGFYVSLSPTIVNDLKRIGVRNISDHFKNKRVEFTGPLAATTLQYANGPAHLSFFMPTYTLDNLRAVTDIKLTKRKFNDFQWPIYPNYESRR